VQAISNNRGVRIGIPSKGHVGSEEAGGDNGESHIYESSCWPSERAAMHGNSIEIFGYGNFKQLPYRLALGVIVKLRASRRRL
jgi:hypothetical protein